jgi:aryl-alcohol dehydrogenase-like predicted oxidoreductase
MNYGRLGRTGLLVSELGFGTQTFGGEGFWSVFGRHSQQDAERLVAQAIDGGINLFDTAEVYSKGESERLLARALGGRRKDVVLASKVTGRFGPGLNDIGLSRKHIFNAIEGTLSRLGTDYIDLYQVHSPDPATPIDETLQALNDVVRAGKVRYLGCSNFFAWQIMKALSISERHGWARFDSLQAYYSIVGRDVEREIVPLLEDQNVGLLVWSPLAGGLLTDKFAEGKGPAESRRSKLDFPPVDKDRAKKCIAAMREVSERHDATVARVALAWLLHMRAVTSVIVGASTQEQLADNIKAVDVKLSPDELNLLDEASALRIEYPVWMIRLAAHENQILRENRSCRC